MGTGTTTFMQNTRVARLLLGLCTLHNCALADVPPPSPNPWTLMSTVTIPGAPAAGAIYPDHSPARMELNYTRSSGWVIHLSGGGWRFLSNNSNTLDELRDGLDPSATGCYGHCDGIMSTDPSQNRLFHSWNKVFIPIS